MASRPLPPELIEAARALLEASDRVGLHAQGAVWLYDHALDEWRYVLVSALVDTMGRRKVYQMLLKAFQKLAQPSGFAIVDVYLESPNSLLVQGVNGCQVDNGGRFADRGIDGLLFDGVILRWQATPPPTTVQRIEREFTERVRKLVEA